MKSKFSQIDQTFSKPFKIICIGFFGPKVWEVATVKKTLMQNKKQTFKNILKYETDQLKTTASIAKSTVSDEKQINTDEKTIVTH